MLYKDEKLKFIFKHLFFLYLPPPFEAERRKVKTPISDFYFYGMSTI